MDAAGVLDADRGARADSRSHVRRVRDCRRNGGPCNIHGVAGGGAKCGQRCKEALQAFSQAAASSHFVQQAPSRPTLQQMQCQDTQNLSDAFLNILRPNQELSAGAPVPLGAAFVAFKADATDTSGCRT